MLPGPGWSCPHDCVQYPTPGQPMPDQVHPPAPASASELHLQHTLASWQRPRPSCPLGPPARSPPSSWTPPAWRRSTGCCAACGWATLSLPPTSCGWATCRATGGRGKGGPAWGGGGEAAGRHLLVDTILPRHLLGLGGAPCVLQQGRHLSACTHKLKAGALPLPDAQNGMPLAHPLPCCAAGLSWCCAAWSLAAPRRWPPPPRASAPLALSTTTACSGLARGRCPRTGARGRGRGHGFC